MTDRRAFFGCLTAFSAYALTVEAGVARPGLDRRLSARRWIDRQDEIARALAHGEMTPLAWRAEVAALAARLDVAQLVAEIRRSRLEAAGEPFRRDPRKQYVRFLGEDGTPRRMAFGTALFSFDAASVITPHVHRHMVSAHMVIDGQVRIRTFDRLRDEAGAVFVRPTSDHLAGVGETSAMTGPKDNGHWFAPKSARAATFDVIISGLDAGQPDHVIQPIDPLGGQRLKDGSIRAPILSFERSMDLYSPDR